MSRERGDAFERCRSLVVDDTQRIDAERSRLTITVAALGALGASTIVVAAALQMPPEAGLVVGALGCVALALGTMLQFRALLGPKLRVLDVGLEIQRLGASDVEVVPWNRVLSVADGSVLRVKIQDPQGKRKVLRCPRRKGSPG